MKRSISILSVLAFVLAFSGSVFAQTTFNANAEVVAELSASEVQQVDFAYIQNGWSAGDEPTIDPSDGTTSGAGFEDGSSATAGFVQVTGTSSQTVDVTVAGQFSITESGSGDTITFTPNYNWTTANLTIGDSYSSADGTNTTGDFSMALDGDGQNTILIGGQLEASSSLTEGSYTGDASITISYQ